MNLIPPIDYVVRERRESYWASLGNLLFPGTCVVCHGELANPQGPWICRACRRLHARTGPACETCSATMLHRRADQRCVRCRGLRLHFRRAVSLGDYRNQMRDTVIRMKHSGQEDLVFHMGRWLGQRHADRLLAQAYDLVVPVPCHWTRSLVRGVHLAGVLAEGVSDQLGLPMYPRLLRQTRPTRKQGTLPRSQRANNVRGAFELSRGYSVARRRILLIDDVMTSGATVNEVAGVLLRASATRIDIGVVARGTGSL